MRFVRIATAFTPSDARLTQMALDQAGFFTRVHNLQHVSIAPHYSLGLDGIPIFVPSDQADAASEFLTALENSEVTSLETEVDFSDPDVTNNRRPRRIFENLAHVLAFWWFGFSNPIRGVVITHRK